MVVIQLYTEATERIRDAVVSSPNNDFVATSQGIFADNIIIILRLEGKSFISITGSGPRGLGKAPGRAIFWRVFLSTVW